MWVRWFIENKVENQISDDVAYMWNLKKKDTGEITYKAEIESQM